MTLVQKYILNSNNISENYVKYRAKWNLIDGFFVEQNV